VGVRKADARTGERPESGARAVRHPDSGGGARAATLRSGAISAPYRRERGAAWPVPSGAQLEPEPIVPAPSTNPPPTPPDDEGPPTPRLPRVPLDEEPPAPSLHPTIPAAPQSLRPRAEDALVSDFTAPPAKDPSNQE